MLQVLLNGDLGWWTGRWVEMKMRATAKLRRKRIGMSRMRSWYPQQVWPLNAFVCSVSFLYKIIDLPVGQIKTPRWENTFLFCSSQELTCLPLEHLKGFKLTKRPFRALDLLLVLLLEQQRHCQRAMGEEVPSKTAHTTLDCWYVENTLVYMDPWLWKANRKKLS